LFGKLEFWLLKLLLRRHTDLYMDQWDRWKLKTKHGDVFITIERSSDGSEYDELN